MLGHELPRLERADIGGAEEAVHLAAEIAQPHPGIARLPPLIEFRDRVGEQRIVVVQPLEGDEAGDQRAGLARLDARREQEEQGVEVVLFGDDAVFAQILRDDRGRDAVLGIGAGGAVEAGREQRQLVRIGHGKALGDAGEAVPVAVGGELPERGIGGELVGRQRLPGDVMRGAGAADVGDGDAIGHERLEEPAPVRVLLLLLELPAHRADFLAQLDAEPDRVVPQHFAGAALHHLRADVERGEQRIERRGRGVLHETFVEAAVLDAPLLAADVTILDVDLRGLRKARELLVGRLRRDDAGRLRRRFGSPMAKRPA